MLRSAADRDCRQAQGDASTLQSHCNTLTAGAHVDPAVAAHHAKIEQEYQTLVADAPDTPNEWHNGAITRRGRRSNQEAERYKAAGHDGCPAELIKMGGNHMPHGHRPVQPGLDIRAVPNRMARAMLPASSKAGPWTPHNATAIAQSQFCQS
jgi:hypothetical protein